MKEFSKRDRAILIGLYLSKYNEEALEELGFDGFVQAFNTLGYSIGSKPASIKNYRDEFDPYFPNKRKGWHKRQIRDYCKEFSDDFGHLDFTDFTELIKNIVIQDYDIEKLAGETEKKDYSKQIAKRLATGQAAEEYFKLHYQKIDRFKNFELVDTRKKAVGFDFEITLNTNFYCVEVKGLNASKGSILLTEKEFKVANSRKEKYCLFIVSNFIESPAHQYFFNPLNSGLIFQKKERQIIRTTYSTSI